MDTEGLNYFQLDCTRMHKYDAPSDWFGRGKEKKTNEIVFALDGESIITVDGSSYIIKPNMLMVFPIGRSFSHRLTEKKKFLYYHCHFDARIDGVPILEALGLAEGNLAVEVSDTGAMIALFEEALHGMHFEDNDSLRLNRYANVTKIIAEYVRLRRQAMPGKDAAVFEPVIEYMKENLSAPPSLQQLAELAHLEPSYFIRRFTNTFGSPPMKYFDSLRAHRAMQLLENTDMSIPEIGMAIGIPDKYYFNKFFEKHCGMLPAGYRGLFR